MVVLLLLFLPIFSQSFRSRGLLFVAYLSRRGELYPAKREVYADRAVFIVSHYLHVRIVAELFPEPRNEFLLCKRGGNGFLVRVPLNIVF